jgi:hypothetical protein
VKRILAVVAGSGALLLAAALPASATPDSPVHYILSDHWTCAGAPCGINAPAPVGSQLNVDGSGVPWVVISGEVIAGMQFYQYQWEDSDTCMQLDVNNGDMLTGGCVPESNSSYPRQLFSWSSTSGHILPAAGPWPCVTAPAGQSGNVDVFATACETGSGWVIN